MKFYSLNRKSPQVSFREAVVRGIAPDRGLYFPGTIDPLPEGYFSNLEGLDRNELALALIGQFVGDEIPQGELFELIKDVLSFDFPLVPVESNVFSLELFHGPTMAFKDVGARFMARCLSHFNKDHKQEVTVLVGSERLSGCGGSERGHPLPLRQGQRGTGKTVDNARTKHSGPGSRGHL